LTWILDSVGEQDAAAVLAEMPPPARLVYRRVLKPRYEAQHRWQISSPPPSPRLASHDSAPGAGVLIARATGRPFETFLRERIFESAVAGLDRVHMLLDRYRVKILPSPLVARDLAGPAAPKSPSAISA
jgi:CubicO group peptidase (beta-lactamase class C family)